MRQRQAIAATLGALASLSIPACDERTSETNGGLDQPSALKDGIPKQDLKYDDSLNFSLSFENASLTRSAVPAPGVLSEPFIPSETEQSLTLNPQNSIVIYLNDLSSSEAELLKDTQKLADQTIVEARYLNVGADRVQHEHGEAHEVLDFAAVLSLNTTAESLLAVVDENLAAGKSVHLVAHDLGIVVASGLAYHIGHRKSTEQIRKLHLLMVGSPEFQNDEQLVLAVPSTIGSLYRVTTDEKLPPLEKFADYLPYLKPEMLTFSGRLELQKGDEVNFAESAQTELERNFKDGLVESARKQARRAAERATQEAERLRLRDDRRALEGEIDQILEGIRATEYIIDDLDNRISELKDDFQSLADVFKRMRGEIREIAESQRITREELKGLTEAVSELESSLAKLIRDYGSRENYSMRLTFPVNHDASYDPKNPAKSDFDGDGVSDKIESDLLDAFRPVLAFHRNPHALPISVSKFRERCTNETTAALEMPVENRNLATPLDEAIMYGRVSQPKEYANTDFYVVQYYILFANNDTSNGIRGTTSGAEVLSAGIIDTSVSASSREAPTIGDHEGDWITLDFTVAYNVGESKPQLQYGILHNHGRQFFVPARGIEKNSKGQPVVFLENGAQELLPSASFYDGDGYHRFPREATTNKRNTSKFFNDTDIIQPHEGKWKVDSIPVFNLGEVKSNSSGAAVLNGDGYAVPVDERIFTKGSDEWRQQQDAHFAMSYPGMWGDSDYRIKIDVGVPYTPFKKKVYEKKVTSPKGPVFNSASNKNGGVVGKYYSRDFQTGGESFFNDFETSSRVTISSSQEGNNLRWDPIAYAHGYIITAIDSTGAEAVFIANGSLYELSAVDALQSSFEHGELNGYSSDESYTYRVEIIWAGANRIIPHYKR